MHVLPTAQELAELDDERLERLAAHWRAQASHGDRNAFGLAHALEVEYRRRQRESQFQVLPSSPAEGEPKPWWKFWQGRDASLP
jgi:hypothetical protein